jgi:hypothetical protein
MLHRKGLACAALTCALALGVPLLTVSSASAAPEEGPAGEAFYTTPSPLPAGGPGTLVRFRPTTINLNVEIPSVNAWDVLYKSTNQTEETDPVTGTVIVPTAAWTGSGARPVVDYAFGTQGLGHACAPSLQMAAGTEYNAGEIIAALKKGYAVVATDYQGYTNGDTPSYIAGKAEGHAVLDVMKAAAQIPGSGLSETNPLAVWGYSQGGHAAGWAGELEQSYAPTLNLVGVAAGGVPANLIAVAEFGEGSSASAFAFDTIVGLEFAYSSIVNPEVALQELLTTEGLEAVNKLRGECAIQSLHEFGNATFKQYSKAHETNAEYIKHHPLNESVINAQKLGTTAVPVPVYHYHGLQDEFLPVTQDAELHEAWCGLGVKDDFQLYAGEHLLTDPNGVPFALQWINERFEGKTAPSTCGQHSSPSELPAGARTTPQTGDLVVTVPAWHVSGSVTDKKLGVTLKVPPGATFSAESDLTSGKLSASLFVPPIEETVKILGLIPVTIAGELTQAGPINGTSSLSNSGVLTLTANGGAILSTKSLTLFGLRIPVACHTESPIELPLNISEPVNALESGSVTQSFTVTIPPFTGCGIFSGITTLLLSGSGNPLTLTVSPPPPSSW